MTEREHQRRCRSLRKSLCRPVGLHRTAVQAPVTIAVFAAIHTQTTTTHLDGWICWSVHPSAPATGRATRPNCWAAASGGRLSHLRAVCRVLAGLDAD